MFQKSHFTTKGTKYALRAQAHMHDCEPFEAFVFYLGVLGGKNIFTLEQALPSPDGGALKFKNLFKT